MTATAQWLAEGSPDGSGDHLVVCLPEAGGGPEQFLALQRQLAPDFSTLGVRMPGRRTRWREAPMTRFAEVLDALVPVLLDRIDRPYLVLGQSLGALLGYELVRVLGHVHGRWPVALGVCSSAAPHLITPEWLARTVTEERIAEVERAAVESGEFDPETVALLLAPLHQDIELGMGYRYEAGMPLTCPVLAWSGADDTVITPGQLAAWSEHTTAGCQAEILPGGHSLLADSADLIAAGLRAATSVSAPEETHRA